MTEPGALTEIRKKAMDLLARREHSAQELRRKLRAREYGDEDIEQALEGLRRDGLQSDERFTEAYVRQRADSGMGPLKIRHELRQKGIADGLADEFVSASDDYWERRMAEQRRRKFGETIPRDFDERMKQARFLQNRGFSPESVMRLFR